ncbi:UvrD-helicase domain-containing protein [Candidatus Saccharibacteria bacterium]|nr:UvrD-helicase domain-containing protein [Candidatus Saccharibacteria bacterium]
MSLKPNYIDLDQYLDHILDTIDPSIKLDEDQKAAVKSDDDCALVVAGAGTGKTTTIAAKVKYLVDIKKIDPSKILVMSYTKKSVGELEHRIKVDLNIQADVTTFHALGLRCTRLLDKDKKVIPIDDNERYNYFLDYLKNQIFPYKEKMVELVETFNDSQISWINPRQRTYGDYFLNHYHEFNSFDEYFKSFVEQKIRETDNIVTRLTAIVDKRINREYPMTIKGEHVKSKGEAAIANYLFCNGIDYTYERIYDELVGERQVYRPDFSIDIGGEQVYIEYFGISGSDLDNKTYQRIREEKEKFHHEKHNKFIALDYLPNRGYLKVLEQKLKELGVIFHPKTYEEIYRALLEQMPLYEFIGLRSIFYDIIDTIKTSEKVKTFEEYIKLCNSIIDDTKIQKEKNNKSNQLKYIVEFWNYYQKCTSGDPTKLYVDYPDMINIPGNKLKEIIPKELNYDYIIVDEYQDISAARFKLIKELIDCTGAKFFAIGDDWQSIYSFQGAKVGYIIDFDKFFPNAKQYVIRMTYRNAQELIDAAGKFIRRNTRQIKKDLISNKHINKSICFTKIPKSFNSKGLISDRNNQIEKIIRAIHEVHPNDSICVLGRTNDILNTLFYNQNFIDSAENKVKIKGINNFYFDAITIHKSKGLTYDWTILMPLTNRFPGNPKKIFWMRDIVFNYPEEEKIAYAEQRRVFYVALTRTRNKIFILYPEKETHSKYKDELANIISSLKNYNN